MIFHSASLMRSMTSALIMSSWKFVGSSATRRRLPHVDRSIKHFPQKVGSNLRPVGGPGWTPEPRSSIGRAPQNRRSQSHESVLGLGPVEVYYKGLDDRIPRPLELVEWWKKSRSIGNTRKDSEFSQDEFDMKREPSQRSETMKDKKRAARSAKKLAKSLRRAPNERRKSIADDDVDAVIRAINRPKPTTRPRSSSFETVLSRDSRRWKKRRRHSPKTGSVQTKQGISHDKRPKSPMPKGNMQYPQNLQKQRSQALRKTHPAKPQNMVSSATRIHSGSVVKNRRTSIPRPKPRKVKRSSPVDSGSSTIDAIINGAIAKYAT